MTPDDDNHWTAWQRNDWSRREREYKAGTPPIQFEHRIGTDHDDVEEPQRGLRWYILMALSVGGFVLIATLIVLGVMHLAERFVT